MINSRNEQETKAKVDEILKKRTKCTKNEKEGIKTASKLSKKTPKLTKKQKDARKKFKIFIIKLILVEYIIFAFILGTCYIIMMARENGNKTKIIQHQQATINLLTDMLQGQVEKKTEYQSLAKIDPEYDHSAKMKITAYCACRKMLW